MALTLGEDAVGSKAQPCPAIQQMLRPELTRLPGAAQREEGSVPPTPGVLPGQAALPHLDSCLKRSPSIPSLLHAPPGAPLGWFPLRPGQDW